jgi:hypothetical protein
LPYDRELMKKFSEQLTEVSLARAKTPGEFAVNAWKLDLDLYLKEQLSLSFL